MADQQQQRARRRLLQHLEERVLALPVQILQRIDDRHAPTALARGRAEERHGAAHIVDAGHGEKLAGLLVDDALEGEKIAVGLPGDAARHRLIGGDGERFRVLHGRRGRIGVCKHEARHAIGQRCLADTDLAADQPGVRNTAAAIGIEQRLFGLGMAEQLARGTRMRDLPVIGASRAQTASSSNWIGAVAGSSFFSTTRQICSATSSFGVVASISTQRSGSLAASVRNPSRSLS